MTNKEYWDEIAALVGQIQAEARDEGRDVSEVLWETIDGHSFVIYTALARDVVSHSDNPDAIWDAFGDVSNENDMFDSRRAYCAMEADILHHEGWNPEDD